MISSRLFGTSNYLPARPLDETAILNALASDSPVRAKDAVKHIVAALAAGVAVAQYFPSVIRWMHVDDLELQKLVFLFVTETAHLMPEDAILVVNVLVKGATAHANPIVRALSLRTMSNLRLERVMEHFQAPLLHCLADASAHVQKTAVVCVAKFFRYDPAAAADALDQVRVLAGSSPNPAVVANALAALAICGQPGAPNPAHALDALSDANEWAVVAILEGLAAADCPAEEVRTKVLPRLNSANHAVVVAAARIVLQALPAERAAVVSAVIGLLNGPKEIEWAALRCLSDLAGLDQSLAAKTDLFLVKYDDPRYVAREKIRLLGSLLAAENAPSLLKEFESYLEQDEAAAVFRAAAPNIEMPLVRDFFLRNAAHPALLRVVSDCVFDPRVLAEVARSVVEKGLEGVKHGDLASAAFVLQFAEDQAKAALVLGELLEEAEPVRNSAVTSIARMDDREKAVELLNLAAENAGFLSGKRAGILKDALLNGTVFPVVRPPATTDGPGDFGSVRSLLGLPRSNIYAGEAPATGEPDTTREADIQGGVVLINLGRTNANKEVLVRLNTNYYGVAVTGEKVMLDGLGKAQLVLSIEPEKADAGKTGVEVAVKVDEKTHIYSSGLDSVQFFGKPGSHVGSREISLELNASEAAVEEYLTEELSMIKNLDKFAGSVCGQGFEARFTSKGAEKVAVQFKGGSLGFVKDLIEKKFSQSIESAFDELFK